MSFEIGDTLLITSDNWFHAPNGEQYKAVWGTLKGIHDSESILGVRTNAKSTNWYIEIGNMILAGCQANMAIKCDKPNLCEYRTDGIEGGERVKVSMYSRIYDADEDWKCD